MAEGAGGEPAQGLLERLVAAILALVQALVELDDGAPARDAGGEPDAARPAARPPDFPEAPPASDGGHSDGHLARVKLSISGCAQEGRGINGCNHIGTI